MAMDSVQLLSAHACYGGTQFFYQHQSEEIGLPMRFSVYLPPQAVAGNVCPAIFFLAGLTCNEETFMMKAGAQKIAAREGLILIAPDTSPRGANLPGDSDSWDLGVGAGFYLDASEEPWRRHYSMESYIVKELRTLLIGMLRLDAERISIMGHSMGGHGALTLALRHPGVFKSVSAFAPIAAPSQCPWGKKAFAAYLGTDESIWRQHDACALMAAQTSAPYPNGILVDQGLNDKFLAEQLYPALLVDACVSIGQPLTLREHLGYDHGYYFVSSFIEDHLMHHKARL